MSSLSSIAPLIDVSVNPYFIEQRMVDNEDVFLFGYQITIANNSQREVQLLRRHWIITDSDGNQSEVEGEGVVGLQPTIESNQQFQYSSGSTFKTPVGIMHGIYTMICDKQVFDVVIAPFRLADEKNIH